ncbi:uncharacterized protein [Nicotiana sylvestris]|uniref:uncharacterized protein n=1 Tax=Nicotiana sylvestris TaxID=4096 RepID=UPI00388C8C16
MPTNTMFPPIKQKLRKFKLDMSLKIKEEVIKQIKAKVLKVIEYPTWLANIVPVPKKDGKVRIWMDEEDVEKIDFISQWGVYYYKMMPFGLKNAWATYMRAMTTIFHDMIHKEIEAVNGQALTDHLAENPVRGAYESLKTYFPDKEVLFVGEDITKAYDGWRMFFNGAANFKGVGIGAVLISETGQHYPVFAKLKFPCTNYMEEYESCILGLNMAVDMNIQELLVIVHADIIKVLPNELNATSSPWTFAAWGIDFIGLIEPTSSNGHKFILVAIDYFIKWVEVASYKAVTKKVVADFVKDRIVCRFEVLESNITDSATNLNSDLMKAMFRTSTGATPYMLVYGAAAAIPAEVEIPQEAELSDAEWIRNCYEQLVLIDGKRMNTVYHDQLYQNRMSRAFNKSVKSRQFAPGQLVLKKIFPHQDEAKGKFSPNWNGPYMVHRVLIGGALILAKINGEIWPKPINSNAVKRYYA